MSRKETVSVYLPSLLMDRLRKARDMGFEVNLSKRATKALTEHMERIGGLMILRSHTELDTKTREAVLLLGYGISPEDFDRELANEDL